MEEIKTKVLLIDLENCPSQINQLMNHLDEYSHIVICYAQSGAKIPVDWMMPLTTVINEGRLKLIKMPEVGKNAADFGIAFWAGVLMAQLPEKAHFDILSNDADLDYVVSLLSSENRSAERRGIKKENPPVLIEAKIIEVKTADSNTQSYYLREYCLSLIGMKTMKPAKKETLLNSIKAKFRFTDVDANAVFEMLFKSGAISINENKVGYNQQKLTKLATVI